jgi:hypothetical protein
VNTVKHPQTRVRIAGTPAGLLFGFSIDPMVAKTGIGKPLFKASDGGRVDILKQLEDATESELNQESGMSVLLARKVRPEAFPTRSPMPIRAFFVQYLGRLIFFGEGIEHVPT